MRRFVLLATVAAMAIATACSSDSASDLGRAPEVPEVDISAAATPTTSADASEQRHPDVIAAVATQQGHGTWRFDVTLSSPYDTAERYADAWRVLDASGGELGRRELLHDHANEQPFTRSLTGVEIPEDVAAVTIEGRDQQFGWGGTTFEIRLER